MNFSYQCPRVEKRHIWGSLRMLESPMIAKEYLCTLHQVAKASELHEASFTLAATIVQTRAYFESANDVPLQTRPLLLYYGLLNLAKVAILAANPANDRSLDAHKHGVSTPRKKHERYDYWRDSISIQQNGVFLDWYRAILALRGLVPDREGFPIPRLYSDDPSSLVRLSFQTANLWACIPEAEPLLAVMHIKSRCCDLGGFIDDDSGSMDRAASGRVIVSAEHLWPQNSGLTLEETRVLFRKFSSRQTDLVFVDQSPVRYLGDGGASSVNFAQLSEHGWSCMSREGRSRPILCIPPLPVKLIYNHTLPEPFIFFLLLFHLSMLARYEPEDWLDLIADSCTTEAILTETLCDLTAELLPSHLRATLGIV